MSSERDQLVDAVIGHLNEMKRRGSRFVALSPEASDALGQLGTTTTTRATAPSAASRPTLSAGLRATPGPVAAAESGPKPAAPLRPVAPPPAAAAAAIPATAITPTSSPSAPLVGTAAKVEAMRELRERALVCMKCPNLAAARINVVFGVGTVDADLMFVGEAPGADEDRQGEPFVGAAGQLLTKIIQTMGLSRETVYIGNILKCRPDTPGQSSGNRKPTPDEMKTCIPYLHSQIDIIRPKVLVALGATAIEGLLGPIGGITKLRGHWHEYRGIPLMPTFHPAYLLRNMALSEKRKVWEDMLLVMERLGLPVSDKQRGFFLPKSA